MRTRPIKAEDMLEVLRKDPGNMIEKFVDYEVAKRNEANPFAITVLDDEGNPVACGGVTEVWPGRAQTWAILIKESGRYMTRITRAAKELFDRCSSARIEITVESNFEQGKRWAEILGFKEEAYMRKYFPNGSDAIIFSKVRG